MRRAIIKVTQSVAGLNAHRWLLVFSCGHEQWVTRRSKPRAKTGNCNQCGYDNGDVNE